MAILAQYLVDRVSVTLNDVDHTRWELIDLVGYLSDAQRAAVLLKPEVNPKVADFQLASSTLQALPADAYILIDITKNIDIHNNVRTPGRVITPTERSSIDQVNRDWHKLLTASTTVPKNYVYDIRNRLSFYVYPVREFIARDNIEIIYSKMPAEISLSNQVIPVNTKIEISDVYSPALIHYMLHRAYEKEIPVMGQGAELSMMHLQAFRLLITGESDKNESELTIRHQIEEGSKE